MKGEKGQCGIALSPSVALGGILLENVNTLISNSHLRTNNNGGDIHDSTHTLEIVVPYTLLEQFCLRIGQTLDNTYCGAMADYVSSNKAVVFGTIGLLATLLLAVWPLTWDCRRRAHRRRLRNIQKQQQQQQQLLENGIHHHNETSTLIVQNRDNIGYGTNSAVY
jgi:hypothetical protein